LISKFFTTKQQIHLKTLTIRNGRNSIARLDLD